MTQSEEDYFDELISLKPNEYLPEHSDYIGIFNKNSLNWEEVLTVAEMYRDAVNKYNALLNIIKETKNDSRVRRQVHGKQR